MNISLVPQCPWFVRSRTLTKDSKIEHEKVKIEVKTLWESQCLERQEWIPKHCLSTLIWTEMLKQEETEVAVLGSFALLPDFCPLSAKWELKQKLQKTRLLYFCLSECMMCSKLTPLCAFLIFFTFPPTHNLLLSSEKPMWVLLFHGKFLWRTKGNVAEEPFQGIQ